MNDQPANTQGLARQIPTSVGVPTQVLIFAGAAVLAVLVGTVSVAAGFALFVLGLLTLVIVDQMVSRQNEPSGSGGGFDVSSSGYLGSGKAAGSEDEPKRQQAD